MRSFHTMFWHINIQRCYVNVLLKDNYIICNHQEQIKLINRERPLKFFLINDFEAITLTASLDCLPSLITPKGIVGALHSTYPHMLLEQHNFNAEMKYHTQRLAKYYLKWYTTLLDLVRMKRSQAEALPKLPPEE